MAIFNQFLLERDVVFNDAVVHHDNTPSAIPMRMRILFSRSAVRGPARMTDSVSAVQGFKTDYFFQVSQFALGPANLQGATIATHRDASGVIAAILQPPQPVDKDGHYAFLANVSHNTAHAITPYFGGGIPKTKFRWHYW